MALTRTRRPDQPPSLTRLLIACLWLVPVVFFAYFTLIERWPEADRALAYLGPGPRLVVGVSVQGSASGPTAMSHRSQVYVAIPESLRSLNAYAVVQDDGQVRVEAIRFGAIIFTGVYLVWIGASLWYLLARGWRSA